MGLVKKAVQLFIVSALLKYVSKILLRTNASVNGLFGIPAYCIQIPIKVNIIAANTANIFPELI